MKLLFGILFLAVFANSKVAGDQFECYKCGGEECEGTLEAVDCYIDSPFVPPESTAAVQSKADADVSVADDNYACYTIRYKDQTDKTLKQRGCASRKANLNPCDSVVQPVNVTMIDCQLCSEPKCNSSATIQLSILAIASAIYVKFLM